MFIPDANSRLLPEEISFGAETKAMSLGEKIHAAQITIPIQRIDKKTATDK
jgi:hypothetical protein